VLPPTDPPNEEQLRSRSVSLLPSISDTEAELQRMADRIREAGHFACEAIIEIGTDLMAAQELLAHGDWLPWLKREFGWEKSQAYRFIQVAQTFGPALQSATGKLPNLGNFDVSALYVLAAKHKAVEEARSEALRLAEAGERITHAKAKALVEQQRAKPAPPPPDPFSWRPGEPPPAEPPENPNVSQVLKYNDWREKTDPEFKAQQEAERQEQDRIDKLLEPFTDLTLDYITVKQVAAVDVAILRHYWDEIDPDSRAGIFALYQLLHQLFNTTNQRLV
jgi:hypothetical protein